MSPLACKKTRPVRRKKRAASSGLFCISFKQARTSPHFRPMIRRQVGILCCTARGLSYLHFTRGVLASCFRFLRHDPGIPTSICGGGNPLGEEIILARVSFNPRRPRGVAAQLRPIVFDRWSVPRSRGVFGPKAGHVVANFQARRVAARASTLLAGAAACCTGPAADSS